MDSDRWVRQFAAVRDAFGITMPTASDIIVGLGIIVTVAIEIAKFVFRKKEHGSKMAYA